VAVLLLSLGATRVPTPGTPVALVLPADFRDQPKCHAFLIQALPTNTGKVYIGGATLNKSTYVGVHSILPVPTTNLLPTLSVSVAQASNGLTLDTLRFDADIATDGVLISVLVA
jgi:hypothetical protein